MFRLTALFNCFVGTPYIFARSLSSMTCWPRMVWIFALMSSTGRVCIREGLIRCFKRDSGAVAGRILGLERGSPARFLNRMAFRRADEMGHAPGDRVWDAACVLHRRSRVSQFQPVFISWP